MRGQDAVSVLKGVGEQREKRLHRLGIVTVEDLLTHYPREYKDRSEILKIADLPPDEPATFLAQIKEEGQNSRHGRLVYTRMKVYDETGAVGVLWYNQPYMKSSLKIGEWYLFSGRLQKKYGRTEVISPECERIGENFAGGRILPVYPFAENAPQSDGGGLEGNERRHAGGAAPLAEKGIPSGGTQFCNRKHPFSQNGAGLL